MEKKVIFLPLNMMVVNCIILIVLSLGSCTQATKEKKSEEQLTYKQLREMVMQGSGEPIEWHGESIDKSMLAELKIIEKGTCGENACGKALYLQNNSNQSVEVTINAPFQIEEVSSYLAARYLLKGSEQIAIGCSHLCYEGERFEFKREIVGAKPVQND